MLYSNKKLTLLALSVMSIMHGGSEDEWITVGPRKKITARAPASPSKNPRSLAATSTDSLRTIKRVKYHTPFTNAEHIPSLAPLPIKPASLPPKPTSASKIITHIPAIQKPIRSYAPAPHEPASDHIPLIMAALKNDVTKIKSLIAAKANICALDTNGATALHWAACTGKTAAIRTILNNTDGIACIGIQDCEGKTPLHRAAGIESDAILALLSKTPREFIDLRDKDGSTALLWAASAGRLPAVKALLEKGANIDAQDFVRHRTPLHWALRMRDGSSEKGGEHMPAKTSRAIIKYLIERNADVTLKDNEGYTALYWARHLKLHTEIGLLESKLAPLRRSDRIRRNR